MAAILQLLRVLITRIATTAGLVQAVLGLAQEVWNVLHPAGTPFDFNALGTQVGEIAGDTDSLITTVNLIFAAQSANQAALLAAIGSPQQAGAPVTLPAPPPGYGFPGLGSGDAATIWNYTDPITSVGPMGDLMVDAGRAAEMLSASVALPHGENPYVLIHWDYSDTTPPDPPGTAPDVDPGTILATDSTVAAWLNRTTSPITWSMNNGLAFSYSSPMGGDRWWVCSITELEFAQYKALLVPPTSTTPPVWPGLSKVTLGSAVPLSTGLTITAPMDGVIVAITAVPPGTALYDFDGTLSYTFVGALSFFSDDSDQEFPQGLGFQSAVYSPKEMVRAAGVKVRTKPGIVGTVTPWSIN